MILCYDMGLFLFTLLDAFIFQFLEIEWIISLIIFCSVFSVFPSFTFLELLLFSYWTSWTGPSTFFSIWLSILYLFVLLSREIILDFILQTFHQFFILLVIILVSKSSFFVAWMFLLLIYFLKKSLLSLLDIMSHLPKNICYDCI